ncbi:DciA family protein [Baaleninema sp.]|uniref:DciA family protein n=1 Tax=Baaleninema sp. TaxID=3101197 RepID=UPI003D04DC19
MSFESIDRILRSLSGLSQSPEQGQLDEIDRLWAEVAGDAIARYSRPVRLSRQVLQVAVATPVWAQQLQFKRRRLLASLNARLSPPLTDIRFSPALWHRHQEKPDPAPQFDLSQHPSLWSPSALPSRPQRSPRPSAKTPREAFQGWAQRLGDRTDGLPLCPQCHCPTPPGELQRWSVCALCASRSFGESGGQFRDS